MKTPIIQMSNDYHKFKFLNANRSISQQHLTYLIESMKKFNMSRYKPIIIDGEFYIHDGQHRFLANKELETPIYFVQFSDEDFSLIESNLNQKPLNLSDFLKIYVARRNSYYVHFDNFLKTYKLSISQALTLITNQDGRGINGKFKKGLLEWDFKNDVFFKHAEYFCEYRRFLTVKQVKPRKLTNDHRLFLAFNILWKNKDFRWNRFMEHLFDCWPLLSAQDSYKEYGRIFVHIYNYRLKNKIEVPEFQY